MCVPDIFVHQDTGLQQRATNLSQVAALQKEIQNWQKLLFSMPFKYGHIKNIPF